MLYGFLKHHIYWQEDKRATFKAFHVTPYVDKILTQGQLLPPSITGNAVLGENRYQNQKTIRGCLLSFFDDFQTAMNGCYNLALYAILDKQLLTEEQFESLVRSEIARYGINDHRSLQDIPDDEILDIISEMYQSGDTASVFTMLGRALEPFMNPMILADAWVLDLPDDIDGILSSVGVFEVEIDCKYIADPSVVSGGFESEVYGGAIPKGDFGLFLKDLGLLREEHMSYAYEDADAERDAIAYQSTLIARYINDVCGSTSAHLTDRNVGFEIENNFGSVDDFEKKTTSYGDSWVYENVVTFVPSVTINPQDLAIWNPEEHEWRIPAPNGIKVDASNVIALASEVASAVSQGSTTFDVLVYKESEIRGRRQNPSDNLEIEPYTPLSKIIPQLVKEQGISHREASELVGVEWPVALLQIYTERYRYRKKGRRENKIYKEKHLKLPRFVGDLVDHIYHAYKTDPNLRRRVKSFSINPLLDHLGLSSDDIARVRDAEFIAKEILDYASQNFSFYGAKLINLLGEAPLDPSDQLRDEEIAALLDIDVQDVRASFTPRVRALRAKNPLLAPRPKPKLPEIDLTCEQALHKLLEGLSLDDGFFDVAKSEVAYAFKRARTPHAKEAVSYVLDALDDIDTIDHLVDLVSPLVQDPFAQKFVPARMALSFEEVLEDVYVIHFTNEDKYESIKTEGLKGPTDTRGLFHTYGPLRSLNRSPNGFLFGYVLAGARSLQEATQKAFELLRCDDSTEDFDDDQTTWACTSAIGMIFKVSHAVSFYHPTDNELQVLFPIRCIDPSEQTTISADEVE